jgi:hypothetical protein
MSRLSENQPSAFADRQFGTSFCTINSNPWDWKVIDRADCKRMFQIGDRRMLMADFQTAFLKSGFAKESVQFSVFNFPPTRMRIEP